MADIVNLRRARKHKARVEKQTQSAENRVKFGESKSAKKLTAARRAKEAGRFESHKRET